MNKIYRINVSNKGDFMTKPYSIHRFYFTAFIKSILIYLYFNSIHIDSWKNIDNHYYLQKVKRIKKGS